MNNARITQALQKCLDNGTNIAFLVGAGISAESGIPTFRGKDGYWVSGSKNYKAEEIGTFRMFRQDPREVWKWYLYRKSVTERAQPNQSHRMLKELEDLLGEQFVLISQNVDGLHRKAGNSDRRTFLIHGDFDFVRCSRECSSQLYPFPAAIPLENRDKDVITDAEWEILRCPKCGELLRPHVLWFDESYDEKYYRQNTVMGAMMQAQLLFVLGTSGATNLPARIVNQALYDEILTVEVNIEESELSRQLNSRATGLVLRETSSTFLTSLCNEIRQLKNLGT